MVPCSSHLVVAFGREGWVDAVGRAAFRGTLGKVPSGSSSLDDHRSCLTVRQACPQVGMQGNDYRCMEDEDPEVALASNLGEGGCHRELKKMGLSDKEDWKSRRRTQSHPDHTEWDN